MRTLDPNSIKRRRATGRERLVRLTEFLDGHPASCLTFSRWYGQGKGCAIGLAIVSDPWFQAQGLGLQNDDRVGECCPVYEDRKDWPAVCAFFEVRMHDARTLFAREGYQGSLRPKPSEMASKIRMFLQRNKDTPGGSGSRRTDREPVMAG